MKTEFQDYPQEEITAKLKQIEEFEEKYKPNATTRAWRKWCTDYNYRRNEWTFRQNVANYAKLKAHEAIKNNI